MLHSCRHYRSFPSTRTCSAPADVALSGLSAVPGHVAVVSGGRGCCSSTSRAVTLPIRQSDLLRRRPPTPPPPASLRGLQVKVLLPPSAQRPLHLVVGGTSQSDMATTYLGVDLSMSSPCALGFPAGRPPTPLPPPCGPPLPHLRAEALVFVPAASQAAVAGCNSGANASG